MNEVSQPLPGNAGEYSMLLARSESATLSFTTASFSSRTSTALGTLDGTPTDAHVAYHEERARGGVACRLFRKPGPIRRARCRGDLSMLGILRSFRCCEISTRCRSCPRHQDLRPAHTRRPYFARASAAYHVGADADARAIEPF